MFCRHLLFTAPREMEKLLIRGVLVPALAFHGPPRMKKLLIRGAFAGTCFYSPPRMKKFLIKGCFCRHLPFTVPQKMESFEFVGMIFRLQK